MELARPSRVRPFKSVPVKNVDRRLSAAKVYTDLKQEYKTVQMVKSMAGAKKEQTSSTSRRWLFGQRRFWKNHSLRGDDHLGKATLCSTIRSSSKAALLFPMLEYRAYWKSMQVSLPLMQTMWGKQRITGNHQTCVPACLTAMHVWERRQLYLVPVSKKWARTQVERDTHVKTTV